MKELSTLISSFVSNKTITSYFNNNKKAVFLDNIDIIMNTDRGIVSVIDDIYPILVKHKVPLVITCKNNEEKKIVDLKTKVEPIKVNYPSIKDAFVYISSMFEQHGTSVFGNDNGIDDDKILALVNKYKGSIRDVVMNMFTKDDEYEQHTAFKDMTQFEVISKLFRKTHSMDEILSLISDDMSMVSFLLYENFPEEITNLFDLRGSKKTLLDLYERLNELFVQSSYIEEFMYKNMEWSLYDTVQLIKLQGANIILKGLKKKTSAKLGDKYRFSQAISKISHKNIMNKKINSICNNNAFIGSLELLTVADKIALDKTVILTSGTKKVKNKKTYDADECNYIATYQKYFIE